MYISNFKNLNIYNRIKLVVYVIRLILINLVFLILLLTNIQIFLTVDEEELKYVVINQVVLFFIVILFTGTNLVLLLIMKKLNLGVSVFIQNIIHISMLIIMVIVSKTFHNTLQMLSLFVIVVYDLILFDDNDLRVFIWIIIIVSIHISVGIISIFIAIEEYPYQLYKTDFMLRSYLFKYYISEITVKGGFIQICLFIIKVFLSSERYCFLRIIKVVSDLNFESEECFTLLNTSDYHLTESFVNLKKVLKNMMIIDKYLIENDIDMNESDFSDGFDKSRKKDCQKLNFKVANVTSSKKNIDKDKSKNDYNTSSNNSSSSSISSSCSSSSISSYSSSSSSCTSDDSSSSPKSDVDDSSSYESKENKIKEEKDDVGVNNNALILMNVCIKHSDIEHYNMDDLNMINSKYFKSIEKIVTSHNGRLTQFDGYSVYCVWRQIVFSEESAMDAALKIQGNFIEEGHYANVERVEGIQ